MATLPRATVSVDPTAAAPGGGADLVCVVSACPSNADFQPRLYGSAQAVYANHGYCDGVEYAALHVAGTARPVLFVPMPIGTPGAISRSTSFRNTGTSVVTIAAHASGILSEHDGVIRVLAGGTIGSSQIRLELSLDGGRTFKPIRLGTATSYVLPFIAATVSFAAGTLVTGDTILEWHGSSPLPTYADLVAVREALAADQRLFRTMLLCGDLPNEAAATSYVTQLDAYATANDRFIEGRASVYDRLPIASLSQSYGRMTGSPALTFTAADDTMVRDTGSWLADGFRDGDTFVIEGTDDNDATLVALTVTALTVTFGNVIVDETVAGAAVTITGGPTLVFSASDTIVRNRGSWLADGFRVADSVTIDGTASNDVTLAAVTVTALTLTLANGLASETILASGVSVTTNLTKEQWMADVDDEFANIDAAPRIDLSAGRGAVFSPFSGWFNRRPAGWFASVREYQHDLHVATWRKDLGPVGADLFDGSNELVEWDDRADGGAGSAARFTTLRTWANGPRGAFVTLSLTRAGDGQIMSLTHNAHVVNEACTVVQQATENVVGRTLILNDDGTATTESLAVIAGEVNDALGLSLLTSRGEGPRASKAVWTPDPADVYNVAEPVMHGTLDLNLNGTVHSVDTAVRVRTNGQ